MNDKKNMKNSEIDMNDKKIVKNSKNDMNDLAAPSMNSMSKLKILNNVTNNITVINSKLHSKYVCKEKDEINARRHAIYAKKKTSKMLNDVLIIPKKKN